MATLKQKRLDKIEDLSEQIVNRKLVAKELLKFIDFGMLTAEDEQKIKDVLTLVFTTKVSKKEQKLVTELKSTIAKVKAPRVKKESPECTDSDILSVLSGNEYTSFDVLADTLKAEKNIPRYKIREVLENLRSAGCIKCENPSNGVNNSSKWKRSEQIDIQSMDVR
jgi:hypothetical protein